MASTYENNALTDIHLYDNLPEGPEPITKESTEVIQGEVVRCYADKISFQPVSNNNKNI